MTTPENRATFETFNDGICSIREIDEDGNAGTEAGRFRYRERTVGIKRYQEALTNKVQIDRLIRIPYQMWMSTEYLAVLRGEVYEIVQVQSIMDSLPKSNDLSLHLARKRRDAGGTVQRKGDG